MGWWHRGSWKIAFIVLTLWAAAAIDATSAGVLAQENQGQSGEPAPPDDGGGKAEPEAAPDSAGEPDAEDQQTQSDEPAAKPHKDGPPAEVLRDLSLLPFPARRMHELLVEAARSGDIEKLRSYVGSGDDTTMLSLGGVEGDPIEFLKSQSGDAEGHEILAILLEVLETGFVHLDAGTENEVFVWPYFFAVPLEGLTPAQKVELFTILTSGDLEEMKTFGAYVFYRVGISPEGRWRFFVAGD